MNAETYLKEHQAEAFKLIAEAQCKDAKIICNDEASQRALRLIQYVEADGERYNPLTNAEQWIECLMWFRNYLWQETDEYASMCHRIFSNAASSREALLIAILKMIGGWDE